MKKETRIRFEQHLIIKPNSLVLFKPRDEVIGGKQRYKSDYWSANDSSPVEKVMPLSNLTNGFLSISAQSRMNNCLKYLFWLSGCFVKKRNKYVLNPNSLITFVTLKLSAVQIDTDTYIKSNMLNQFITELKDRYPNVLYVWRAEKQMNGNLHFHFLLNIFIKWELIRKIWNRIQAKEGYIARYTTRFSVMSFEEYILTYKNPKHDDIPKIKLAYKKGQEQGWTDPNSIDVCKIKDIEHVYYYISKYMSKKGEDTKEMSLEVRDKLKIEGRIYYCCSRITRISKNIHPTNDKIIHDLDLIYSASPKNIHTEDYFICISLPIEKLWSIGCKYIFELFIINLNKPVS